MILNALALKLKRLARGDFKGRHFEATLIVQAVSWWACRKDFWHRKLCSQHRRTPVR